MDRTLKLISDMELSLWHPIMDDIELLYGSQVKIVDNVEVRSVRLSRRHWATVATSNISRRRNSPRPWRNTRRYATLTLEEAWALRSTATKLGWRIHRLWRRSTSRWQLPQANPLPNN